MPALSGSPSTSPSAALLPRWGWATLALVASLGMAVSIAAWRYTLLTEREANRTGFERRVQDTVGELQLRLDESLRLLRSTAALFAASSDVSVDEWKAFADGQHLGQAYPGLLGIGHAPLVAAADLGRIEAGMRQAGYPDYRVWPPGDRAFYAPVLYREPLEAQGKALGYDMLTDPVRRDAMGRARSTGEAAMSSGIVLASQDSATRESSTLLYFPIYAKGVPVATDHERRNATAGWVFTPIDVDALMGAVVLRRSNDMTVELWDGPIDGAPQKRLFDAHLDVAATFPAFRPSQATERPLDFAGRRWTLRLAALPAFDASQPASRAQLILAAGAAITLLMTLLVGALLNMRGRALALAERISAAYRASESRVRTVLDNAAEGILTVGPDGRVMTANPTARLLLGIDEADPPMQLQELLSVDVAEVRMHLSSGGGRRWRREAHLPGTRDGRTLMLAASEVHLDDGSQCLVLMLSDVSELERARARADDAGALNQTILACAPFCVIATDAFGRIRSVNAAGCQMLGYRHEELEGVPMTRFHLAEELAAQAARLSAETGRPVDAASALVARALLARRDEIECTYLRKDGSHLPVMAAVSPLLDAQGHSRGVLCIAYDITERKRSEAYIRHMAHHDDLTGLPNRALLHERAALAIEALAVSGKHMAVLLLDLDRFKQINDSLGHQTGDVVLCTVAARLKQCVRAGDTVARMGGDEFVILLPDIASAEQAERVAAGLLTAMAEPVQTGTQRLTVTPSIGIACFPHDGGDLPTLMRNADVAMYQSKTNGRNGYTLYTEQMHAASARRLELEGDLRQALERNQLALHYQPLVSLADGSVIGAEALLRWTHPVLGAISPVDFIPIAEDTGLIVSIGEWVLRTACQDMKRLQQRTGRTLNVAVNLSPRQLRAPNLTTVIADALSSAGWAAANLELEITESMVIDNPEASVSAMKQLRAMGLGLAIDDFGTGYSSLSYLTRFPVGKLKLDRSFVSGLPGNERDAAIATAVVAMGHGLKLKVLAEGIETEAQMQFLRGLGCEMGQGWLFARAMTLDALVAHLASATAPLQPALLAAA